MQLTAEQPTNVTLVQWCAQRKEDYSRARHRAIRGEIEGAYLDASNRWRVRVRAGELAASPTTTTEAST